VSERDYIFDPDELTMIFTATQKNHIRVAFSEGKVWYAICDVAKLLKYRAPGKAANYRDYGVKLLRVPHVSKNVRGYTNCNCITKDALKRFLKFQSGEPDICDWLLNVMIPEAEKKFAAEIKEQFVEDSPASEIMPESELLAEVKTKPRQNAVSLLEQLDRLIIAAVSLRQELQAR